eukprot:964121-Prymnesium_polylepis.1
MPPGPGRRERQRTATGARWDTATNVPGAPPRAGRRRPRPCRDVFTRTTHVAQQDARHCFPLRTRSHAPGAYAARVGSSTRATPVAGHRSPGGAPANDPRGDTPLT